MAKYVVDLGDFMRKPPNIGETRDMARIGGLTVGEMQAIDRGDLGSLSMSAMIGVVYVMLRRANPRFTEHDMNGINWDDIEFVSPEGVIDGQTDPPQPLPPMSNGAGKRARRSASSTA